MAHIELTHKRHLSIFRRMAIGTWRTPIEALVYGTLELRMEKASAYLDQWRRATGKRLTVTHLVARAAAQAMREMPEANAMLRFSRVYLRKNVDVFLQVVLPSEDGGKVDLTGVTLRDVDQKSLEIISEETERKVRAARKGEDKELQKSRSSFRLIPLAIVGLVLRVIGFFSYTLNVRLPGMPRDPFGSMMITNVGSLGIDTAYVPLVPYSRVPIILAVGAVKDQPVVDDGQVVPGKVMKINVTFDHRFIDGFHAGVMSRTLTTWFSDPEQYFGALPASSATQQTATA